MSNSAKKKARQRLKREKKKAELRRANSISPYKRIGQAGPLEACYINSNWRESGLASIHVIRRNPAGGHALAAFLVDVWCAGLKDAWGRIDLMQEDVNRNLDRARGNFELIRIELETVQNFLASAIRFSRQNGFRLPAHYDRWINLVGGISDTATADLSGFGKDGKLQWVGPIEDLRSRLVGCSVEEFFARPDVEFVAGFSESDVLDDDEDEFETLVDQYTDAIYSTAEKLAAQAREEYARRGKDAPQALENITLCLLTTYIIYDDHEHPSKPRDLAQDAKVSAAHEIIADEFLDPEMPNQIRRPRSELLAEVVQILNDSGAKLSQEGKRAVPGVISALSPDETSPAAGGPDSATDTMSPPSETA